MTIANGNTNLDRLNKYSSSEAPLEVAPHQITRLPGPELEVARHQITRLPGQLEVAPHQITRLPGQSWRWHHTKSHDCQIRVGGGTTPNHTTARSELEVAPHQITRLPGQLEVAPHQITRLPGQSWRWHHTKSHDCQVRVGGGTTPNHTTARSELEVAPHQITRLPGPELEVAPHQITRLPGQSWRWHHTKSHDCQVRVGGGTTPNHTTARSELEVHHISTK